MDTLPFMIAYFVSKSDLSSFTYDFKIFVKRNASRAVVEVNNKHHVNRHF